MMVNLNEGADITKYLKIGPPLLVYGESRGRIYNRFSLMRSRLRVEDSEQLWGSQAGMRGDRILDEDSLLLRSA
jgi:hypothetical protein